MSFADYAALKAPKKAAANARRLLASDDPRDVERGKEIAAALNGAGRCRTCGRPLSDPESVRLGEGPDCRAKRR